MNRAFKVIQGHPYWCQQKYQTDCCHNVQQCRHYFRNLRRRSIGKTANSSLSTTPLRFDDSNPRNTRISRNNLYCQKLESLTYISALVAWVYVYFLLNYFWKSNALSQEVLAESGFWHEIATQGHSRSFILQSITGRQGVAYRRIILLALSLKYSNSNSSHSNRQKLPSSTTPLSFDAPAKRNPGVAYIRMRHIYPETSHWPIFVAESIRVYLQFIQICAVGSKRRIFSAPECVLAVQDHPKSMILVQIESAYAT